MLADSIKGGWVNAVVQEVGGMQFVWLEKRTAICGCYVYGSSGISFSVAAVEPLFILFSSFNSRVSFH